MGFTFEVWVHKTHAERARKKSEQDDVVSECRISLILPNHQLNIYTASNKAKKKEDLQFEGLNISVARKCSLFKRTPNRFCIGDAQWSAVLSTPWKMESNLKMIACNFGYLSCSHSFVHVEFFASSSSAAAVCCFTICARTRVQILYCCHCCGCCCCCCSATLAECALNTHITTVSHLRYTICAWTMFCV